MRLTALPLLSASYNPSQAENGKFVQLDTSTLNRYSVSGTGRFATLVWVVNPSPQGSVSNSSIVTSNGTVFAASVSAVERSIQNLQTTVLYVRRGASASASNFDWALPACTDQDDGTSAPILIDNYFGVISIFAASGSPRAVCSELS
jgi:hypothetical protein